MQADGYSYGNSKIRLRGESCWRDLHMLKGSGRPGNGRNGLKLGARTAHEESFWHTHESSAPPLVFAAACAFMETNAFMSEIRIPGSPRKRYYISDIRHSGYKLNDAFQTHAESRMRNRAVLTQIEIPPIPFNVDLLFEHTLR